MYLYYCKWLKTTPIQPLFQIHQQLMRRRHPLHRPPLRRRRHPLHRHHLLPLHHQLNCNLLKKNLMLL